MTARTRRLVLVTGLLALLAVPAPASRAQAVELGGFALAGAASGMEMIYDQPGLFPVSPSAQGQAPFASTTLATGPSGTALASLAWPGPLAANWGTAAEQAGAPPGFGDTVNYKVRSEAASPQGPTDHSNDSMPGVTMRTHAQEAETLSTAQADKAGMPGAASTGTLTAVSRSFLDDQGHGVAEAVGTASDIELLAGLIRIDSVVSVVSARTDGVAATVEGDTTVNGLEIAGQKAVVDESGPHAEAEEGPAGAQANSIMERALAESGVTIRLAGPSDRVEGASGERVVGGLVVSYHLPSPAPSVADQTVILTFGGAMASVAATEGFAFDFGDDPFEDVPPDDGSTDLPPVVGSGEIGPTDTGGGEFAAPVDDVGGEEAAPPPPASDAPASPIGYTEGLPAVGVLAVLAGAGLLALAFRRLADDVLAQGARTCLIEGGRS